MTVALGQIFNVHSNCFQICLDRKCLKICEKHDRLYFPPPTAELHTGRSWRQGDKESGCQWPCRHVRTHIRSLQWHSWSGVQYPLHVFIIPYSMSCYRGNTTFNSFISCKWDQWFDQKPVLHKCTSKSPTVNDQHLLKLRHLKHFWVQNILIFDFSRETETYNNHPE